MHGHIIVVLESNIEFFPIIDDVASDVKVSRLDLVLLNKCGESIGCLYEHVKKMVSRNSDGTRKKNGTEVTHRKRSVVERDTDDTGRSIKYITRIATTV